MIRSIAIFGAGTMGGGIAISTLMAGLSVRLIDTGENALIRARERILRHLSREVEKGRMTAPAAQKAGERLHLSTDAHAAAQVDLVIEAVFEDLAVKHDLLKRIEPILRPNAIIATNTSCLRVSEVGRVLHHRNRFLGLHYFSPAEISSVVELIPAAETSPGALKAARDFLAATNKEPLPCKDSPGFALNRFFCPYCNEAVRLLDEGLGTTGQIDQVACDVLDLSAGPFRVMNITKPGIMFKAMESLAPLGAFYEPAASLAAIARNNALWPIEPEPEALPADRAAQVADRLKGAILLASREALNEGVVSAADMDRGARAALRFGLPPVALSASLSKIEVDRLIGCTRPDKGSAGFRHQFDPASCL